MSVDTEIATHFRKYIPSGETILATMRSKPLFGLEKQRYCITERRFAMLEKSGLLSWDYCWIGIEKLRSVWSEQGIFKSEVLLFIHPDKEEFRITNIRKSDAQEFVATCSSCIEQDHEVISQRTKVCPGCDELVKYRAKYCRHCGHRFS